MWLSSLRVSLKRLLCVCIKKMMSCINQHTPGAWSLEPGTWSLEPGVNDHRLQRTICRCAASLMWRAVHVFTARPGLAGIKPVSLPVLGRSHFAYSRWGRESPHLMFNWASPKPQSVTVFYGASPGRVTRPLLQPAAINDTQSSRLLSQSAS